MSKTENIDNLISKFLSGNALPEEAMLLEDWKNEDAANQLYFSDCEKIYRINEKQTQNENTDDARAWDKIRQAIRKEASVQPLRKNRLNYFRIAASVAFIMGIGAFIGYILTKNEAQQQLSYSTTNKVQFVKLKDSTEINVLANSKIVIDPDFGVKNRIVHLKGNADFSVTHKDELPFIVDAGNFFIKDIGTKFSVKLSPNADTVYVNVEEGVVLLYDSLGAEMKIKASEKAIYIHSGKQLINTTEIKPDNVVLEFNNTALSEVVLRLNSAYKTNIVLQNMRLNKCTITTTFAGEDIDTILKVITETLGLSFERTGSGYLIKGQGCQS